MKYYLIDDKFRSMIPYDHNLRWGSIKVIIGDRWRILKVKRKV